MSSSAIGVEEKRKVDEREIAVSIFARSIHQVQREFGSCSDRPQCRSAAKKNKLNKITDKKKDKSVKKKQSYCSLCWMNDRKAILHERSMRAKRVCERMRRNRREKDKHVSAREKERERVSESERERERCSANDKCVSYLCLVTNYVCIYVLYTHGHTRKKKKEEVHYIPHM